MQEILTVTELTTTIKSLLESAFGFLWVTGEISNLRQPRSGHVYCTLKAENSQIRAVVFRQTLRTIGFDLEDGMNIVCRGRLSVYQQRGEYQLIIDAAEPRGLGALQMAFEQLKKRLEEEGLFDPSRKRNIPFLPRRIGIVTSSTGAAIRDILHITKRRYPSIDILIAPVRVQGVEAPPEICGAIATLNTIEDVDVIIVTRGGGSLEDLFPFNNERVARAIFESKIPVISAVGHEIDFTIADFVADLRAPTPSAAAELVVPIKKELVDTIRSLRLRMINSNQRMTHRRTERLSSYYERVKDPRRRIEDLQMNIDDLSERLVTGLRYGFDVRERQLTNYEGLLKLMNPLTRIHNDVLKLDTMKKGVVVGFQQGMSGLKQRLQKDMALLDILSPLAVLERGYGIVRKLPDGTIFKSIKAVEVGDNVNVTVSSGSFNAQVTEIVRE
ncbi:MAG: exodeoxyribonuclease VII large subunit [Deltaproteobacteria bacterium]|nr:exodeoxyribonuclease VII large subunit [Deltaproteobacteria bacterium]